MSRSERRFRIGSRGGAHSAEVDFDVLRIASASFFDESFGILALRYPIETIQRRLQPTHLTDADRDLLNSIVSRRARERLVLWSSRAFG